ncbi:hypothetical protein WNZ15_20275 [Roseibium sp. AS2]|uniref:hypothetical protein n=1 Tax=Roseibium sp. AS2 TaxID=3135781 RepID=UPI00317FE866
MTATVLGFCDHGITQQRSTSARATCGQYGSAPPERTALAGRGTLGPAIFFRLLFAVQLVVFALYGGSFAAAQNVSCTCRYQGADYGLGDSICLKSPDGMRMATCDMVLNNTSWKLSDAPCPVSRVPGHDGDHPPETPWTAPRLETGLLQADFSRAHAGASGLPGGADRPRL